MILLPLFLFFAPPQVETAESIMAKVAQNQDRAEHARTSFVYHQNVLVRANHTNGKLAHEQYSEYTVTPTPGGVKKERTLFAGKYAHHGKVVDYKDPKQIPEGMRMEIDGDLCDGLSSDLTSDNKSKDGVGRNMFPLTVKEQTNYVFTLKGTEDYQGTPVYVVTFEPAQEYGQRPWAGEALIDRNEFQPVLVSTHLALKIPLFVRTVLGTNIQNLGFKITYKKFDEGLWFPVTYGGEMKIRALFFYARRVGVSMQNSGFRRASVKSAVTYSSELDRSQ